jgi:hypothetical protein
VLHLRCQRRASSALYALAHNFDNFMRTFALPKAAAPWSLTSLPNKLINIGAKVRRGRRVATDVCGNPIADRLAAGPAPPA